MARARRKNRSVDHAIAAKKIDYRALFESAAKWACQKFGWKTPWQDLAAAALKKWFRSQKTWLPNWLPKYLQTVSV